MLVCTLDSDAIPGRLRYQWVGEMFPQDGVRVVHINDNSLPQSPPDHPDFWTIWGRVIRSAAPEGVDFFFASEDYGAQTAAAIGGGCRFVCVDRPRELVPVSGTRVRSDPMKYWQFIPEPVRPYFVKRVCVFGPESTGKSVLARDLAREFETVYAWEFARPHLDPQGGRCFEKDIPLIVRGQIATEDALARQANRVIFCDTDPLTTTIWSDVLFGSTPAWIRDLAAARNYDLYLLLDVDVPWVDDNQRFFGDQATRREMFRRFEDALKQRGRRYKVIGGSWEQRLARAREAVTELLSMK